MPNTCAVTGNVKNLLGQNVQNCTVKASVLTPFFHTGGWISGEVASTATDASGNFSISVVETETVGTKITFSLEYNDGTAGIKRRAYTVVVPDDATASLADLVASPVSPVTFNTIAAQYVTVAAISNLAATQAQAAFAELQADIDTRALDADLDAHLADTTGAHAASAISFSAGGTISGTDVQTAVAEVATDAASALSTHEADTSTHGVATVAGISEAQTLTNKAIDADANTITNIDNADIKAGAAIDRSKLASGTNYRILANGAAGAMSENAAITASRAVASDANGQLEASATTATELGYVSGVTSAIQTQINTKAQHGVYTTYTPGTQGLGTVTINEAGYVRLGSCAIFFVRLVTGTTTAVQARVDLPANMTLNLANSGTMLVGTGYQDGASAAAAISVLAEDGNTFFMFGNATGGDANKLTQQNGNYTFVNAEEFSFYTSPVPIAEWS